MLDGVLDPMYPYDPQFQCDRCDRSVDKMDERSVLRLLFYPSVEAGARIKHSDESATFCPDCQRRLRETIGEFALTRKRPDDDWTDVSPSCDRCGKQGDDGDEVVHGWHGIFGPPRWMARLCEQCAGWLRETVAAAQTERTPYDGGWYRPPALRRAETAVESWERADTGSVTETLATLHEGDVVRLAAYKGGGRSRGAYLGLTATVDRVLAPLTDGPPAQVDLRAVEHELTVPYTPRDDRWTIQAGEYGPTIGYRDADLDIAVLTVLSRTDGNGETPSGD